MTTEHAEPRSDTRQVRWLLTGATLAFYLVTLRGYGYFRDELYYLACGRHLGLGYVDQPPLIGWLAAGVRGTLGTSLPALRLLPALAAAATVWVSMRMAARLGGGRFAQGLAGLATALAPVYLSLFSIFSMNAFDVLAWALLWWLAVALLDRPEVNGAGESSVGTAPPDPRLWLVFGLVAGLGLENKISVLFLGMGLAVGLLVARRWDVLRSRWLWLGGALAVLLFVPYVAWQVAHGWPTLEFMHNARLHKNVALSPWSFFAAQILQAGPVALPVWISGLLLLLGLRRGRPWRALGWAYLAILAVMTFSHAKPYYLGPAYTLLFAAGGVAIEGWTAGARARKLRPVALTVLAVGGAMIAPLAKPLLSEDHLVRYSRALGVQAETDEHHEVGRLDQFFADMHGWPELAQAVARVYDRLPPADRARACVFGQNYGEAGAVDLFGPALGVPGAISAHNSYFLWGPGHCTGEVMIVIGDDRQRLEELFSSVEDAGTFTCVDCMPYENHQTLWVARGLKGPVADLWPSIKNYN